MIRRPPRSTQSRSSAASDVYKRQVRQAAAGGPGRPRSTGPNASWDGPASDHPARWLNRTAGPDRAEGARLADRGDEVAAGHAFCSVSHQRLCPPRFVVRRQRPLHLQRGLDAGGLADLQQRRTGRGCAVFRERAALNRDLVSAELGVAKQVALGRFVGAGLEVDDAQTSVVVALEAIDTTLQQRPPELHLHLELCADALPTPGAGLVEVPRESSHHRLGLRELTTRTPAVRQAQPAPPDLDLSPHGGLVDVTELGGDVVDQGADVGRTDAGAVAAAGR